MSVLDLFILQATTNYVHLGHSNTLVMIADSTAKFDLYYPRLRRMETSFICGKLKLTAPYLNTVQYLIKTRCPRTIIIYALMPKKVRGSEKTVYIHEHATTAPRAAIDDLVAHCRNVFSTGDTVIHMARVDELTSALRSQQIPIPQILLVIGGNHSVGAFLGLVGYLQKH